MPIPSVLIFKAKDTIGVGVLSRAIGLPVRSLQRKLAAFAQVSLAATAIKEVFRCRI